VCVTKKKYNRAEKENQGRETKRIVQVGTPYRGGWWRESGGKKQIGRSKRSGGAKGPSKKGSQGLEGGEEGAAFSQKGGRRGLTRILDTVGVGSYTIKDQQGKKG